MNKPPIISIIVPVFKTEKYLCKCVESLLAQTFSDFELLLIDDGSPDQCGQICDEYALKDKRIRVFHKKNGGASSARNFAFEHISGKYVVFCDSDDWVQNNWLESFLIADDFDIVVQAIKAYQNGIDYNPLQTIEELSSENIDFQKFFDILVTHENLGYLVCRRFKRSIISNHNLRFDTDMKVWEDQLFIFQYMKYVKSFCTVNKALYEYDMPDFSKKYRSGNLFLRALGTNKVLTAYNKLGISNDLFHCKLVNRLASETLDVLVNIKISLGDKRELYKLTKTEIRHQDFKKTKSIKAKILKALCHIF